MGMLANVCIFVSWDRPGRICTYRCAHDTGSMSANGVGNVADVNGV